MDGRKWPWQIYYQHPNNGFSGFIPEPVDKRQEWISPYGATPACERCGENKMSRLFSTFAVHKSSLGSLDSFDDAGFGGMDESDPRAMAQMMRGMGGQMDEDMGPEFDEMIDRMEAGEGLDDKDYGGDGSDDFDDFEA